MRAGTLQSLERDFFAGRAEGPDVLAAENHDEQSAPAVSVCRTRAVSWWKTYVGAAVVVDRGLGHHRVVLELGLAEGRGVGLQDCQRPRVPIVQVARQRTAIRMSLALPPRRALRVLL